MTSQELIQADFEAAAKDRLRSMLDQALELFQACGCSSAIPVMVTCTTTSMKPGVSLGAQACKGDE